MWSDPEWVAQMDEGDDGRGEWTVVVTASLSGERSGRGWVCLLGRGYNEVDGKRRRGYWDTKRSFKGEAGLT